MYFARRFTSVYFRKNDLSVIPFEKLTLLQTEKKLWDANDFCVKIDSMNVWNEQMSFWYISFVWLGFSYFTNSSSSLYAQFCIFVHCSYVWIWLDFICPNFNLNIRFLWMSQLHVLNLLFHYMLCHRREISKCFHRHDGLCLFS